MEQITLTKRVLVWWECAAFLEMLLLAGIIVLVFVEGTWLWYLLFWLLGASYVLVSFLYLPLLWLSMVYELDESRLICHGGVLFPKTRVMRRERIAFVTRVQGPVSTLLHTVTIVVHAAGGTSVIHMVDEQHAQRLYDALSGGAS